MDFTIPFPTSFIRWISTPGKKLLELRAVKITVKNKIIKIRINPAKTENILINIRMIFHLHLF
jgi:hypothetical protein